MILNEKTVYNKILQRVLIQQLIKLKQKFITISQQYQQIEYLTNKIESQQIQLQFIENDLKTKKNERSMLKYRLLNDLEKRKAQRQKELQSAALEMKQLNQNCLSIQNQKQHFQKTSKLQTQLKNQLEGIQINIRQGQHQILTFQFLSIQKLNEQKQLLELRKLKSKCIDEQKLKKQKRKNIAELLNRRLLEIQNKVSSLNYENSQLEISETVLQSDLEVVQIDVQILRVQNRKKKLNVFQIQTKIAKNQKKISEELEQMSKNNLTLHKLRNKTQELFIQMSEINEEIIKTRQLVISLNICKTTQQKLNQQLKLKAKQLMEITLRMTKDSPQL